MAYQPPHNPNTVSNSKVRVFDGIGGPLKQILRRYDPQRGFDISNTVANEVQDCTLGKYGELKNRNGKRKINDTGRSASIDSFGLLNIGQRKRYGVKFGDNFEVVDIPIHTSNGQPPLDFVPSEIRFWTVAAVKSEFTVQELLEKTVRELVFGDSVVATVYPASFPGDPL